MCFKDCEWTIVELKNFFFKTLFYLWTIAFDLTIYGFHVVELFLFFF